MLHDAYDRVYVFAAHAMQEPCNDFGVDIQRLLSA